MLYVIDGRYGYRSYFFLGNCHWHFVPGFFVAWFSSVTIGSLFRVRSCKEIVVLFLKHPLVSPGFSFFIGKKASILPKLRLFGHFQSPFSRSSSLRKKSWRQSILSCMSTSWTWIPCHIRCSLNGKNFMIFGRIQCAKAVRSSKTTGSCGVVNLCQASLHL